MESFSSMAMTNVICDADDDADDDMLPKSAAAAAARGRVFKIGAPGRDPDHLKHVTRHTLHVTHHTSHVTRHTIHHQHKITQ